MIGTRYDRLSGMWDLGSRIQIHVNQVLHGLQHECDRFGVFEV